MMSGQTDQRQACALCANDGGQLVWRDGFAHVVLADEPDYPGFTRVILDAHLAEMTDLAPVSRERLMAIVFRVEQVQREVLRPDKINLASFGNVVPHLHWHVIPRWRDDRHFPQPVGCTCRSRATGCGQNSGRSPAACRLSGGAAAGAWGEPVSCAPGFAGRWFPERERRCA